MRALMRIIILCLCCFVPRAWAESTDDFNPQDWVVPVDGTVANQELSAYANAWWQWAYAMPQRDSPVRDLTGVHCAQGQEGPVWFLAGGFGSSKIERHCQIPANRHLFFPIINMIVVARPDARRSCADVKADAAANNDRYVQLRATLNGQRLTGLQGHRIRSDSCFDPLARVPEEFAPPSWAPSATDGYWLMLRPLPAGQHELSFQAFYTNQESAFGEMVQNISYTLTITP